MKLSIQGIPSQEVDRIRRGGNDANGQPALRRTAEVLAGPCRHCLGLIAEGQEKLILAYRPFDAPQPYAETGPSSFTAVLAHSTRATRSPAGSGSSGISRSNDSRRSFSPGVSFRSLHSSSRAEARARQEPREEPLTSGTHEEAEPPSRDGSSMARLEALWGWLR